MSCARLYPHSPLTLKRLKYFHECKCVQFRLFQHFLLCATSEKRITEKYPKLSLEIVQSSCVKTAPCVVFCGIPPFVYSENIKFTQHRFLFCVNLITYESGYLQSCTTGSLCFIYDLFFLVVDALWLHKLCAGSADLVHLWQTHIKQNPVKLNFSSKICWLNCRPDLMAHIQRLSDRMRSWLW